MSDAQIQEFRTAAIAAVKEAEISGTDLIIWKVDLGSALTTTDPLTKKQSIILSKFLRAREFKIPESCTMLVETLKWRKEFNIAGLSTETFSPIFNKLGQIHGVDKNGKPVTYNYYGSIQQDEIYNHAETFLRWRIQLMEKAIDLLDFENGIETVTQVHDYSGASLFMDKRMKAVSKQIIAIFQNHYPELLERKFFLGVPTLMEYLFSIFTALVSPNTKAKFVVVSKANSKATLLEYINADQLPDVYGGLSQGIDAEIKKLVVKAGSSEIVDVAVKKGEVVEYEFTTVAMDIAVSTTLEGNFGEFIAEDGGEKSEGAKGRVVATADGLLKIKFDNSYSYINEKTVLYRVVKK